MKKIVILGSTGSIGKQALEIVRRFPDDFKVVGLAAHSKAEALADQIERYQPDYYYLAEGKISVKGAKKLSSLEELASVDCDLVLCAVNGLDGLNPSLAALRKGTPLAAANKEALVCGGKLMWKTARENNTTIIPVDSEHSALWQCMVGENKANVKKMYITASGGALRDMPKSAIEKVKAKQALQHPIWNMGKKITIDSATLFNKGLEVIEAVKLFEIEPSQIDVLLHPQSIVHAMVQFNDNSFKASIAAPDMLLPIELALYYPDRGINIISNLDFAKLKTLEFGSVDHDRFPCLKIALNALKAGDGACVAVSSADEVLVQKYLNDEIGFYDISDTLEKVLLKFGECQIETLDDVFALDAEVRKYLK